MKNLILLLVILGIAACKENKINPDIDPAINNQQAITNTSTTTEIVIDEASSGEKGEKMVTVSKGKQLPNSNYFNQDGSQSSYNKFKGKTVVIDFWATWCTPCLDAMPSFDKLASDFSGNSNLVFLKISIDEDRLMWANYVKQKQHNQNSIWIGKNENNPLYWLTYKQLNYEGKDIVLESLPRYAIIGPDGSIIDNNAPTPQTNKLLATINSLKI